MAYTVHLLRDATKVDAFAPSWRGDLAVATVRDLHVFYAARRGMRTVFCFLQRMGVGADGTPCVRWLADAGWETPLAEAGVGDGDTLMAITTTELVEVAPLARFVGVDGTALSKKALAVALREGNMSWDREAGVAVVWQDADEWAQALKAAALGSDVEALPRLTSRLLRVAATYACDAANTDGQRYDCLTGLVKCVLLEGAPLRDASDCAAALAALLAVPSAVPRFELESRRRPAQPLARELASYVERAPHVRALFAGGDLLTSLATRLRAALAADDALNDAPPLAHLARTLARGLQGGSMQPAWLALATDASGAAAALAALFDCRFAAAHGLHWAPSAPQLHEEAAASGGSASGPASRDSDSDDEDTYSHRAMSALLMRLMMSSS